MIWSPRSPDPRLVEAVQRYPALARAVAAVDGAMAANERQYRALVERSGGRVPEAAAAAMRQARGALVQLRTAYTALQQQFREAVREARLRGTLSDADYERIAQAGLAGFDEEVIGTVAPSSAQYAWTTWASAGTGGDPGGGLPGGGAGSEDGGGGMGAVPVLALAVVAAAAVAAAVMAPAAFIRAQADAAGKQAQAQAYAQRAAAELRAWERSVGAPASGASSGGAAWIAPWIPWFFPRKTSVGANAPPSPPPLPPYPAGPGERNTAGFALVAGLLGLGLWFWNKRRSRGG